MVEMFVTWPHMTEYIVCADDDEARIRVAAAQESEYCISAGICPDPLEA